MEHSSFRALGDDLARSVLVRAPFSSHAAVRAVCRRFDTLIRSPEFGVQRREAGCVERGVVVAGGCARASSWRRTAACWLLASGRWRPIRALSRARADACSVVVDNEMWILGGTCDPSMDRVSSFSAITLALVEAFDPAANAWRDCPRMRTPRSGAVAGAVGRALVVAGGFFNGDRLASAEALSLAPPARGRREPARWRPLPPMPYAANEATACVLNDGRLYVAGGMGCTALQVWSGAAWSLGPNLPAVRWAAASAVDAGTGKMMIIGGRVLVEFQTGEVLPQETASVIVFDPRTNAWESGPSLPAPRCGHAATFHEGHVTVVGYGPALQLRDGEWAEVERLSASPFGDVRLASFAAPVLLG